MVLNENRSEGNGNKGQLPNQLQRPSPCSQPESWRVFTSTQTFSSHMRRWVAKTSCVHLCHVWWASYQLLYLGDRQKEELATQGIVNLVHTTLMQFSTSLPCGHYISLHKPSSPCSYSFCVIQSSSLPSKIVLSEPALSKLCLSNLLGISLWYYLFPLSFWAFTWCKWALLFKAQLCWLAMPN